MHVWESWFLYVWKRPPPKIFVMRLTNSRQCQAYIFYVQWFSLLLFFLHIFHVTIKIYPCSHLISSLGYHNLRNIATYKCQHVIPLCVSSGFLNLNWIKLYPIYHIWVILISEILHLLNDKMPTCQHMLYLYVSLQVCFGPGVVRSLSTASANLVHRFQYQISKLQIWKKYSMEIKYQI